MSFFNILNRKNGLQKLWFQDILTVLRMYSGTQKENLSLALVLIKLLDYLLHGKENMRHRYDLQKEFVGLVKACLSWVWNKSFEFSFYLKYPQAMIFKTACVNVWLSYSVCAVFTLKVLVASFSNHMNDCCLTPEFTSGLPSVNVLLGFKKKQQRN